MIGLNYFKVQLKRTLKILPYVVGAVLAIALFVTMLCAGIFSVENQKPVIDKKIGVGFVGDTDNNILSLGFGAFNSLDTAKDNLEIKLYNSRKDAENALKKGDIAGFVEVTDDFVNNVRRGQNIPVTYVTRKTAVDLTPALVDGMLDTLSNLLVESQSGIFSLEKYYIDNKLPQRNKNVDNLTKNYLDFILERNDLAQVVPLGEDKSLSVIGYYLCGFFTFLVMMIGVVCSKCLVKNNMSLPKLLKINGCNSVAQIFGEFFAYLVVPIITCTFVFLVGGTVLNGKDVGVAELSGFDALNIMGLLFKLFPVIVLISSMQFLIYEFCTDLVSGTLVQFFVCVCMCYVSGCFYPVSFFPETIQKVSTILPTGVARNYTESVLMSNVNIYALIACILMSVLFVVLCFVVRTFKLRSRLS